MSRKIIQIAVSSLSVSELMLGRDNVLALCDDGTVWNRVEMSDGSVCGWVQLPPIPQDTPDKKAIESMEMYCVRYPDGSFSRDRDEMIYPDGEFYELVDGYTWERVIVEIHSIRNPTPDTPDKKTGE